LYVSSLFDDLIVYDYVQRQRHFAPRFSKIYCDAQFKLFPQPFIKATGNILTLEIMKGIAWQNHSTAPRIEHATPQWVDTLSYAQTLSHMLWISSWTVPSASAADRLCARAWRFLESARGLRINAGIAGRICPAALLKTLLWPHHRAAAATVLKTWSPACRKPTDGLSASFDNLWRKEMWNALFGQFELSITDKRLID